MCIYFNLQALECPRVLDDVSCLLYNPSLAETESLFPRPKTIIIKGSISSMKVSWPEATDAEPFFHNTVPVASGFTNYGSFGKTRAEFDDFLSIVRNNHSDNNDSGMSSEDNEDVNHNLDISVVDSETRELRTKCLNRESPCAFTRNEIPCCSNDIFNQVNILDENVNSVVDNVTQRESSDFFVIDLTCDVDDFCDNARPECVSVSTGDVSVIPDRALVTKANNELVRTEKQKLVSLSLSILLAALLQAMRYFSQFLENFLIPQR